MLLDLKNCSGELCWRENRLEVGFDLSVYRDGSINLRIKDIPFTKDVLWLDELYNRRKRYFEFLHLSGHDVDGNSITSDSVVLNSLGPRMDESGDWISLEGQCIHLRVDTAKLLNEKKTEIVVQYRLLGFQCFDRLSGRTDLGTIGLTGVSNIKNYNEVAGVLTIKRPPEQNCSLDDWLERCDMLTRSILDIVSFANDRYITWTRRSVFHQRTWAFSLFVGPRTAGSPSQPVFSYLHLQPILNLTLSNYTEELKKETGIDVAIEWFLMKSTYAEGQFLAAMTALEHLIHVHARKRNRDAIFEKDDFYKILRPQIGVALEDSLAAMMGKEDNTEKREGINRKFRSSRRKIDELNRYPFKENLRTFLKEYEVPLDGIAKDIELAIDARHQIVHRGLYTQVSEDQSIRDHLAVLRELLVRIFLTLLKYDGQYQSFLNGQEDRKFPSSAKLL